jgi:hypothetical protein
MQAAWCVHTHKDMDVQQLDVMIVNILVSLGYRSQYNSFLAGCSGLFRSRHVPAAAGWVRD